ncbi:MAG: oligoendopeptidase F [Clostridium sp.]|jgi:oligoendopeptidase F|nr:oligoendopeptidase F [Clostridium sp.]
MSKKVMQRSEVEKNMTWDLSDLYAHEEDVINDLDKMNQLSLKMEKKYKGNLGDVDRILEALQDYEEMLKLNNLISSYRFLAVSVDMTNEENQSKLQESSNIMAKAMTRISFIESEILENDQEVLEEAKEKGADKKHFIEELLREKPHALNKEVEKAFVSLSSLLESPMAMYNRAKLQDLDFEDFVVDNVTYPMSFVLFENHYDYDENIEVRRAAFKSFSKGLKAYENTIAGAYQTQVQKEKAMATLKGFDSVIDYLLFNQEVTREMYDRQIDVIYEELAPHMKKYVKILQKIHGLEEMTFNDLKLSVDSSFEPEISVEEAKTYVMEGLSILGEDYLSMVDKAFEERWIDFAQNKGKSTGAFCASPYGAHPYMLISWTKRMREVFVLAHELGHAGHFSMAQQNQNIFDARASLYFIEAPSTMNEMIMAKHLLKTNNDLRFRRWVLSSMVSRTYYHNFVTHMLEAHFQREVYRVIDEGGSVGAKKLNELMAKSLKGFFGNDIILNPGSENTWMRQQHYYKGLYSYTYSAGLTISTMMAKRLEENGDEAIEEWKKVLKAGGTKTPVELSKMVGIDITNPKALKETIAYIGEIVDEIEAITEELEK